MEGGGTHLDERDLEVCAFTLHVRENTLELVEDDSTLATIH
jgi:hypothetical protein